MFKNMTSKPIIFCLCILYYLKCIPALTNAFLNTVTMFKYRNYAFRKAELEFVLGPPEFILA